MAPEPAVAVYGAGAVGCFLGAKLADVGQVTLIGRPSVVRAISENGLIVVEGGVQTTRHVAAVESVAALPPADLVLLTVRTFDVSSAIPGLRCLLREGGVLMALQNGVGTEETLATELGRECIVAGTLTVSVGMEDAGIVNRYSRSGGIALATMSGEPVAPWLISLFAATGLPTVEIADYHALRWSKLLLNMLGAAQSAILDMDAASIAAHPDLFRLEQLALREAGRVMDAMGVDTIALPGYPVPLARLAMRLPRPLAQRVIGSRLATARGGHSPTMRADVKRGRSEIAAMNGAVARAGRQVGVPAPINAALAALVEDLARHPERRDAFQGRPDQLIAWVRR